MNRITINKYSEMKSTAEDIAGRLQTLNDKCKFFVGVIRTCSCTKRGAKDTRGTVKLIDRK